MIIGVLVKPVPDPEMYHEITIDSETKRLNRAGIPSVLNTADKCALETALQLKDLYGGTVIVFAMTPPENREKILECLAMGADEAILVSDREFGGADTLATSYTLAQAIKQKGAESGEFDLILSGNESADGATGHVPVQTGELLGYGHLSGIVKIEADNGTESKPSNLRVFQKFESGINEFLIKLPAVIGVTRDITKPRYTSAMGVIKARQKPVLIYDSSILVYDKNRVGNDGSPTKAGEIYSPDNSRKVEEISGNPEEIAEEIFRKIKASGIEINSGEGCRE